MTEKTRSAQHAAAFLLFSALALVWTWPLGSYFFSRIPHDPGDPILNTYLIWWNAQTLPFTEQWWNPPFFFPMRGALALSEHLAGLAIISSPIQWLGGSPILAYNVCLLASYALSAWFAYLLVYRLTGSLIGAACAGLAYGFAPVRAGQVAHLQVLTSQWLPLQLLGMHAYIDNGGRKWLWLAGAAWLLQGLSNGYYLLFAPVVIALWLLWLPDWRRSSRRGLALAGTLIVASLPFVPTLLKYREVQGALGLSRGTEEIAALGAPPSSFLSPPALLAFWPSRAGWTTEHDLFPGATVLVAMAALMMAAVVRPSRLRAIASRSPLAFYAVATVLMASFALGPGDPTSGWRVVRPYYWLTLLPGYGALRVPARFAMLSILCCSVVLGLLVAYLTKRRPTWRPLVGGLVIAGLLVDGWTEPLPLIPPPGRLTLTGVPENAAILELPPDDRLLSLYAMYRALSHHHPLVNGYSGYVPPHYEILSLSIRRDDPTAVLELARGRPLLAVVSEQFDPGGYIQDLVKSLPGVARIGSGNAGALYLIPPQPRERVTSSGVELAVASTSLPRAHALLDLGSPRAVRTIEFRLGRRYRELGGRVAIEKSFDGTTWETVSEDWTGGRALAAMLEDPRTVPFRIPLPDISARYLRLHPIEPWMLNDMRVVGP
ncbi:MAG: hypothetical protein WBC51_26950 [Vicinamibacterales bacterium]